jgi:hypothetical protein
VGLKANLNDLEVEKILRLSRFDSGPSRPVGVLITLPSSILNLREFHLKTLHEVANIPVQNFSVRDPNLLDVTLYFWVCSFGN